MTELSNEEKAAKIIARAEKKTGEDIKDGLDGLGVSLLVASFILAATMIFDDKIKESIKQDGSSAEITSPSNP